MLHKSHSTLSQIIKHNYWEKCQRIISSVSSEIQPTDERLNPRNFTGMKFPFHCWLNWQGGRTLVCHFMLRVSLLLPRNPCSQVIKSWLNSELLNRTIKSTTPWKPGRKKKSQWRIENLLTNSTSCHAWLNFIPLTNHSWK